MAVGDMWQVANPITGKPKQLPVLKTFKVYFYANDFHMPAIKNNYILLKKKKVNCTLLTLFAALK